MTRSFVSTTVLVAGMLLAGGLLAGCGSDDESGAEAAHVMSFKLTDAGCEPAQARTKPGSVEFEVVNAGTSKVTEFEVLGEGDEVLGEVENLSDGLSGEFTVTLDEGTYTLYCPGGEHERGTLTVEG